MKTYPNLDQFREAIDTHDSTLLGILARINTQNAAIDAHSVDERSLGALLDQRSDHPPLCWQKFASILEGLLPPATPELQQELWDCLELRFAVVQQIGEQKKEHGLHTSVDTTRWQALLKDRIKQGKSLGLAPQMVEAFFTRIHTISVELQDTMLKDR